MEIFLYFFCLFAVVTLEQIGCFSSVKVLDEISQGMFLDALLEAVEEHGDKLLDILLHHDVD